MKKTYISIFFLLYFLIFSTSVFTQNKAIDSLSIKLQNHKAKDTTRVILLYKLAFDNFQRDLELTKTYLAEAEYLSNKLNYIKGKAKVLYLKGILESRKSNYKESLDFFKRSLKHYESIQDRKGIAANYAAFGITHFVQSQYKEALYNYKKSSKIYEDIGNKRELINSYIYIANVYSETGRYTEALSNFNRALKQSEAIGDEEGISYVHRNIAFVYKMQGNYPLAIDNYNKSLVYTKKNGDTLGMAIQLNNLGGIYNSIGQYDKALEYHNQSLNFSLQKENKEQIALNNGNIGNTYLHKKDYTKALKYYRMSLETSQEINDLKQTSICFNNIGDIYLLLNKHLIARENFIIAKDISQKTDAKHILSTSFLGIAKSYLKEKKHKEALINALKANEISTELKLLEQKRDAQEILSEIYEELGDYKKAFVSYEQFKILNDSLFNKENIQKITQIEYEYKYKQALDSASIRELKLTEKVTTTSRDLAKSKQNYLFAIIGVLLVSMLLGSTIFYQKFRTIKAKNQTIATEQKLLRSQMTPHFIFNSLSVLQGMILNKEDKKSVNYLSKFSKLMRITLENSRDKLVLLSQELLAIENYLALQNLENESYQYTISVDYTIDSDVFQIPPMLIQPFVENAIEHAFIEKIHPKTIDIKLNYSNKNLICTIADNGIGINVQKENINGHKTSLATTITSERLQILSKDLNIKGSISIEDRAAYNEKGTLVTLIIPHKLTEA